MSTVRRLRRGTGVGLVTAIFLLVVLAGLAVAMVSLSGVQQAGSALDVQGARAYQEASAGIMVTVTCTSTPGPANAPADNAAALVRYVITATACNLQPANGACPNPSNNPDYVERQIVVTI
jgi:MSHA biogenesis protein MshP